MNRELEMAKLACHALDEKKGKDMSKIQSGCSDDCLSCGVSGCCAARSSGCYLKKILTSSQRRRREYPRATAGTTAAESGWSAPGGTYWRIPQ